MKKQHVALLELILEFSFITPPGDKGGGGIVRNLRKDIKLSLPSPRTYIKI